MVPLRGGPARSPIAPEASTGASGAPPQASPLGDHEIAVAALASVVPGIRSRIVSAIGRVMLVRAHCCAAVLDGTMSEPEPRWGRARSSSVRSSAHPSGDKSRHPDVQQGKRRSCGCPATGYGYSILRSRRIVDALGFPTVVRAGPSGRVLLVTPLVVFAISFAVAGATGATGKEEAGNRTASFEHPGSATVAKGHNELDDVAPLPTPLRPIRPARDRRESRAVPQSPVAPLPSPAPDPPSPTPTVDVAPAPPAPAPAPAPAPTRRATPAPTFDDSGQVPTFDLETDSP